MSPVRNLQIGDMEALQGLFRSFPYKAKQQQFQNIDSDVLAAFFVDMERRRFQAGGSVNDRFVGLEGESTMAFAGLQADEWHSRFYPFQFGRIAPLLVHQASPNLCSEMIDTLLLAAQAAGLQHLSVRIDGSEYELLHRLQERGFFLVDCSVKLSMPLSRVPNLAPPSRAGGMSIREYRSDDLPFIMEIAATSHSVNHFYNDPFLSREQTNKLFEGWVEKCCNNPSNLIQVVEHRDRPAGFVIYINPAGFNKAMRTHLVILDFVCLSRTIQGGGIGRWFISQTLRRMGKSFTMVELRTSQNNYAALGCYETLGMQIISSDFILHWHGR